MKIFLLVRRSFNKGGFLFIFSFFFFAQFSFAQNLVPNPSFEDTISCPDAIGQIDKIAYWSIFNNSTPDYFNVCANLHLVSQNFGCMSSR